MMPSIFDEQFEFLQKAQIPVAMLSVLLAIPRTPLYKRLEAEGRLLPEMTAGPILPIDLEHDEHLHWEGTDGRTNFRPLRLTMDELQQGQKESLPEALLSGGVPEAADRQLAAVWKRRLPSGAHPLGAVVEFPPIWRRHNWRQGPRARRFFWGSLWTTLRHSPRSLIPINMQLGMYEHFAQVHCRGMVVEPLDV